MSGSDHLSQGPTSGWELAEITATALGAAGALTICAATDTPAPSAWAGVDPEVAHRLTRLLAPAARVSSPTRVHELEADGEAPPHSASGAPLRWWVSHVVYGPTDAPIGYTVALFSEPRAWTPRDASLLGMLSRQVSASVALNSATQRLASQVHDLEVYKSYFENGPDLAMRLGAQHQVIGMSSGWERTLGYPISRFLDEGGRGGLKLIHPDDLSRVDAATRTFQAGASGALEYRIRHADGRWRWLSWVARSVDHEVVATARDITEQREAAALLEALAEAQQRYIQGAPPAEVFGGLLTQLQRVTDSPLGFIGEVQLDRDGTPWLRCTSFTDVVWQGPPPEGAPRDGERPLELHRLQSLYGVVLSTGQPILTNSPTTHAGRAGLPEGHPPLTAFLGLPIQVGDRMVGMVGLANRPGGYQDGDIEATRPLLRMAAVLIQAMQTEAQRKASTEELIESEARFRAVVEGAQDGWLILDQDARIVLANPSACRMYGYRAEELQGRDLLALVAPDLRGPNNPEWMSQAVARSALRAGGPHLTQGCRADGSTFPVEYTISRLNLRVPQYAAMVRDVTERQRVERIKSEFVSTVSHELRTPLTSVRGALGLLSARVVTLGSGDGDEVLRLALANAERLNLILSDILDMEKILSGRWEFSFSPLTLSDLVRQAVEANTPYAAVCGTRLELVEPLAPGEVRADPDRLAQVLNNVLSNACKHSPSGEPVTVTVQGDDRHLRVVVRDRGPGVPEAFRDRIFLPFSQADGSNARAIGGTGLGLSISRSIMDRLGGRIGFDDAPGGGARFWIELPRPGPVT